MGDLLWPAGHNGRFFWNVSMGSLLPKITILNSVLTIPSSKPPPRLYPNRIAVALEVLKERLRLTAYDANTTEFIKYETLLPTPMYLNIHSK